MSSPAWSVLCLLVLAGSGYCALGLFLRYVAAGLFLFCSLAGEGLLFTTRLSMVGMYLGGVSSAVRVSGGNILGVLLPLIG